MNYLITIIGPTAIGKTALSIKLAKHFNCDIISCDSRQFYAEMSIGTAVPEPEELDAAKHHFIQNKSIFENYSVGDFEQDALKTLDKLFKQNNIQILVGGSGLYVDAVLKGFDEFPEIPTNIRNSINENYEKFGLIFLQEQLKNIDANYYQKLTIENPQTLQNPQRLKRFLEVCIGTGKPYSSYIGKRKNKRNFTPIVIALEANREMMYQRINLRVLLMMEKGLLEEAKLLYPHKHLNALQTVGYRELFDYFDKKINLEEAIIQIQTNTRRFAKRQITWFKRTENVQWYDFVTPYEIITDDIKRMIERNL
jgi:tRNA dimethylallyltransferase